MSRLTLCYFWFSGHSTSSGKYRPAYLDHFDKKSAQSSSGSNNEEKDRPAESDESSPNKLEQNPEKASAYQQQFQQVINNVNAILL